MISHWDEFSKSLAEPLPRRESLRRLGAVLAGVVLSPLGLQTAWAGYQDPCKTFCRCRNKSQKNACLAACRACNNDPSGLCGSCGTYSCCGNGQACCGSYCADLTNDVGNCGSCGAACDQAGPYEYGACISGECDYFCVEGADRCDGQSCTYLGWDPNNCGACRNVCGGESPFCYEGACIGCPPELALCDNACVDTGWDPNNCGACGYVCDQPGPNEFGACIDGRCEYGCYEGAVYCDGTCTFLGWDPNNCGACGNVCDESTPYCSYGACIHGDEPCPGGATRCNGVCTNLNFDTLNCGGCGIVCGDGETCSGGVCQSPW